MRQTVFVLSLSAAVSIFAVACDKGGSAPAPAANPVEAAAAPAPAPAAAPAAQPAAAPAAGGAPVAAAGGAAAEAKTILDTRCALCHGADGSGNGAAAAALNPKPRNWKDAEWQKSTTDEQIAKVIVEGGQAIGKSPLMAANPDLKGKDEVVKELVKLVRAFK
ncbi:MAG: c-type cytochrome [Myxococcota bacterium]